MSIELKDNEGRVTHKFQQLKEGFVFAITAYVYSSVGLRYVVPPEMYHKLDSLRNIPSQVKTFDENDVIFKEGMYGYVYDTQNRLIAKHLPGGGYRYSVYDQQDREVMFADESDLSKGYWQFQKFDALGRKILGGIKTGIGSVSRATLQTAFDGMTTEIYEEIGTGLLGYTNRSFPVGYETVEADVKLVNYYDDYSWNNDINYNFQSANAFHAQGLAKGILTGSLVRNLENNDWYKFLNYVDYKGRIIQQHTQNHLGGIDRMDYQYRFNNEVLSMRLTHRKTGENDLIELYQYDYDHLGRKTQFRHTKDDITQTVASYNYDDIGRLLLKNIKPIYDNSSVCTCPWIAPDSWSLGRVPTQNDNVIINPGTDITIPTGSIANAGTLTFKGGILRNYGQLNLGNFGNKLSSNVISSLADPTLVGVLQSIDYKYEIRGNLRGINLDANNNTSTSNGDLFSMKLGYETDGYFDGNIGKQEFKNSLDNVNRLFTYSYDGASRITGGAYVGTGTENYSLNAVTYDGNGNIKTLSRSGYKSDNTFGVVDNLAYTYQANSNKIQKVDDISNETASFTDATGATDYTYSLDGSLTSDANKGITNIEYNYLKKPRRIVKNGVTILYQYDALGNKLKETIGTNFTDYNGNTIYKNGALYQISHDEGRIINGEYEYNIKDHLGNLRVAFRDSLGVAKITQHNAYGIFGEELPSISYFKAQWKKDEFRFTGQENLPETGYTDFGARFYDNIVPRFITIDPLTEVSRRFSPYTYANNNPLRFTDPDGMMAVPIDDYYDNQTAKYLGSDGASTNNNRLISASSYSQISQANGGTISATATSSLQSGSKVITINEGQIQTSLQGVRDNSRGLGIEHSVYIALNPETAIIFAVKGPTGDNGETSMEYSRDDNTSFMIGGEKNQVTGTSILLGQAHGHPLTNADGMVNEAGTSIKDKKAAIGSGVPVYSVDSYSGKKVGGTGAIHRASPDGIQTNFVGKTIGTGTVSNFNIGLDALQRSGGKIK